MASLLCTFAGERNPGRIFESQDSGSDSEAMAVGELDS